MCLFWFLQRTWNQMWLSQGSWCSLTLLDFPFVIPAIPLSRLFSSCLFDIFCFFWSLFLSTVFCFFWSLFLSIDSLFPFSFFLDFAFWCTSPWRAVVVLAAMFTQYPLRNISLTFHFFSFILPFLSTFFFSFPSCCCCCFTVTVLVLYFSLCVLVLLSVFFLEKKTWNLYHEEDQAEREAKDTEPRVAGEHNENGKERFQIYFTIWVPPSSREEHKRRLAQKPRRFALWLSLLGHRISENKRQWKREGDWKSRRRGRSSEVRKLTNRKVDKEPPIRRQQESRRRKRDARLVCRSSSAYLH